MGDGITITLAREAAGYTTEQLAKMVGITEQRLISLESNPSDVPARLAKKISNSLELSIDALDFSAAEVLA